MELDTLVGVLVDGAATVATVEASVTESARPVERFDAATTLAAAEPNKFDSVDELVERSSRSSSDSSLNVLPRRRPCGVLLSNDLPDRLRTLRVLDFAGFIAVPFQNGD